MKLRTILLACTAILAPSAAMADPFTAFFAGLGLIGGTTAAVGAALFPGMFAAGAFLTTTLGSLILNIGLSLLLAPRPSAPKIDAARVNSRLPDAVRWQAAGTVAVGGEAGIFGEYDADGNFWFIVAHADSPLGGSPAYILDGIEVELSDGMDGFTAGDVLTDDFCLNDKNDQYEGSGTRVPYFRIYTVTPAPGADYGTKPSAFTSAFPDLPADFLLVGVTYSIIRCAAVKPRHYSKVMRWRGPIGLREPAVNIVANFSRMYDPREAGHDIDDPTTWTVGDGNPAIIWAWWRTNPRGRGRPMSEVNWDLVAVAADACDELVEDRAANMIPRYRAGVAYPDSMARWEAEQDILKTFAAFIAYDDAGLAYPVAGVYTAPTLTFTADRDILTSQTQIIDDGEAAVDGVIVSYISPDHGWTKQESAPWVNTAYYDGSAEPRYQKVEILGCQNHNQAVRLAAAIGREAGATKKAAITTTVKGVLAKGAMNINLDLDAEFSGVFKIASPVAEDGSGMSCAFAVVPMSTGHFDLAEGEEGEPPELAPILDIDDELEAATGVVVTAVSVLGSDGDTVRLEASFDDPARPDRAFRFRFSVVGDTIYEDMQVDMDELRAWSRVVDDGVEYLVQWQTVTAGGRGSDWSAGTEVTAIANPTAPPPLAAASVTGGAGQATVNFTTANSKNQASVRIYRGTTTVFGSATVVTTEIAAANVTRAYIDVGLSAGTYYYWAEPRNGSGVAGTATGPMTATVT